MEEQMTIQRNRALPQSMDYDFLRKEGLRYIEELSSDLWTDYNAHDPGITILEALCYAITELGYRSRFDMKDLLTGATGQTFFTAKQILTINPLTINDYRKLLADLKGVQNAWLFANDFEMVGELKQPVNEVPLYVNCSEDKIDTTATDTPLFLSGLYKVLLSLENHDQHGDLNNGDIIRTNPPLANKYPEGAFNFSFEFPSWKNADFDFANKASHEANIQSATLTTADEGWNCDVTIAGVANPMSFGVTIPKQPASGKVNTAEAQAMFNDKGWLAETYKAYADKVILAQSHVKRAIKTLHERRNLCEDFISVTTADDDQIAFCFDTDVSPDADIEKIEAEIFFAIENYLNPPVQFFSLKELMDKKVPVDEIFEGPVLQHGFIDTVQLESTKLKENIYASDIINLLMDIEGIIAIRNFQMTKYSADGKPVTGFKNIKWCMPVTPLHKPVLRTDRSKILLFKNDFPFLARYDEVKDTISLLHAIASRDKLDGLQDDLPVPAGAKRDTNSYWPVQHDLPQTYGVNETGLPIEVSTTRKVQQRQLKGYLMFYEQLLADFFSQLSNAHQLFSTNPLTQTYYAQFLDNIADTNDIFRPNKATATLRNATTQPDSTKPEKNEWQKLYEPKEIFEDRRSRFLDHLLARFAESFNEYVLLMYKVNYVDQTEERISFTDIAEAKVKTLKNYPEISNNRGRAFNYFPQTEQIVGDISQFSPDPSKFWDTDNVSGLEKRISTLTGINDFTRRFLYCIKNSEIICTVKEVTVNDNKELKCFHSFIITSRNGISLTAEFEDKLEAEKARAKLIKDGTDAGKYKVVKDGDEFRIKFGDKIASTEKFSTKDDATKAVKEFAAELQGECGDPEGLHLIEHILLRPRTPHYKLMQVCLHDCDCPCEFDPYSFRASVVLPYWPDHFDNMAFRQYFENKIREEAPAHVMLKICWLSNEQMREFELRYKKWVETLAAYSFDKTFTEAEFMDANDRMIGILGELHSEYPQASLHNCDESKEGSNTVVLNKTVLGTFKT